MGVLRRWRWTFWLLLIAFLLGVLRVPASVLELTGWLAPAGPTWYVLLQALIGLAQFGIGLLMLAGYRRSGVWGRQGTMTATWPSPRARASSSGPSSC